MTLKAQVLAAADEAYEKGFVGPHAMDTLKPIIDALADVAEAAKQMCDAAEKNRRMFAITNGSSGTTITYDYRALEDALAQLEAMVKGEE